MVGAGAGSGKTFLLVKKIGDLLCTLPSRENPIGLEKVLALTFTRKAAGEMRARVYREVLERLDEVDDGPLKEHLTSIKEDFQAAGISTIHGFASSLLRSHPVAVGVDPDFEVLDQAEEKALIRDSIRSTLDDLWAAKDPGLLKVLDLWSLYQLRVTLERLLKNPIELNELIRTHETVDLPGLLKEIRQAKAAAFKTLVNEPTGLLAQLDIVSDHCRNMLAVTGNSKEARSKRAKAERLLAEFVAPLRDLARPDQIPETDAAIFENLKKRLKDIGVFRWGAPSGKSIVESFEEAMIPWFAPLDRDLEALDRTSRLLEVVREAAARFEEEKMRRGRLSNDDLLIRAHDLCSSRPETVRGKIVHILVDEFQDTDPLQWDTLRVLASREGRGPENLFLVGDSKQAIYGFRGADHTVTESARDLLKNTGDGSFKDRVMHENFRSLAAPLLFTNELFDRIFTGKDDPSNPYEVSPQPLSAMRPILEQGRDMSSVCLLRIDPPKEIDPWEAEARAVVRLLSRISRGEEGPFTGISDTIAGGKPAVGILFRAYSSMPYYTAELLRMRLPFTVYHGRTFFEAPEVHTLLNLLRWLSDPEDDTSLAGVLRSPLPGWTDENLALLARTYGRSGVPLWEKLRRAACDTESKSSLTENALEAWELLSGLRKLSRHLSLSETLRAAMDAGTAPLIFSFGVRGPRADANIEKFLSIVREMEGVVGASPLTILRAMKERIDQGDGEAEAESPSREGAAIQLMSIHAAKGLEFPLIITACCGKAPGGGSGVFSRRISLRDPRGNGMRRLTLAGIDYPDPARDSASEPTVLKAFLQEHDRLRSSAEEKRLLYVALTRARDHLLIPLPMKEEKGERKFVAQKNSMGEILLQAAPEIEEARPDEQDTVKIGESTARVLSDELVDPQEPAGEPLDVDEQLELIRAAAFGPAGKAPEVGELPYPRKTRLSVTEIMTFSKCPRRFYFEKFLPAVPAAAADPRISEAPAARAQGESEAGHSARIVGTVVHAIIEKREETLGEWTPGADPPQGIVDALEAELARLPEKRVSIEAVRADVLAHLRNAARSGILVGSGADPAAESTAILREVPFELEQGDFIIAGAIDRLEDLPDGSRRILDYKTSGLEGRSKDEIVRQEAYDVQLRFYAWAANRILDKAVDSGGILFTAAKEDPLFPVPVEPEIVERTVTRILGRIEAVVNKSVDAFPPAESSHACGSCPFAGPGFCESGR
jgi:ATP-dependent helicase/nuclease subunit A